jgi:hypothetical protein
VVLGSVEIFGDDWLDKEENAKLCDVLFSWLLNETDLDMTSDRQVAYRSVMRCSFVQCSTELNSLAISPVHTACVLISAALPVSGLPLTAVSLPRSLALFRPLFPSFSPSLSLFDRNVCVTGF